MQNYEEYLQSFMVSISLAKLFLILMLIGHVMACTWYYIGTLDEERDDMTRVLGWVRM
eukprot:SAG11_NODE_1175_length_5601_cov_15.947110_2_plen_58_part_00